MSTEENVRQQIEQILGFDIDHLAKRSELGEINFEEGFDLLINIQKLYSKLKSLPIEQLPYDILQQFENHTRPVLEGMQAIKSFSILQANPAQARDRNITALSSSYEAAYKVIALWLPFLKLEGEEASAIIKRLQSVATEAQTKLENIVNTETRIESIAKAAQDAAAKVGVAHHATRFAEVAAKYGKESRNWLRWTSILAGTTVAIAIVFFFFLAPTGSFSEPASIQKIIAKIVLFSVLLTASVWSARNYRALRHLEVSNEHRQHALGTFETFAKAAGDAETKNAVLMETTRSIFQFGSSGFIPCDDSALPATKMLEVVRNIKITGQQ